MGEFCSEKPCKSGMHFNNMYVEAENPIEFLQAQVDARNKEKGSYYVLVFAMSDFHPPIHTFSVPVEDDDEDKDDKEDDDKEDKKKDEKDHDKKDKDKKHDKGDK